MRLRRMVLADLTVGICAGRVEVAQRGPTQAVRLAIPFQHLFHKQFRVPIRVNRLLRMQLGNWQFNRIPVRGTRRGKNDHLYLAVHHRVQ